MGAFRARNRGITVKQATGDVLGPDVRWKMLFGARYVSSEQDAGVFGHYGRDD